MEKFRAPRSRAVFGGTAPARVRCGHTWGRRSLAAPELRQSRLCRRQGLGGVGGSLGASGGPLPWRGDERSFRRGTRVPGRSVRGGRKDLGSPLLNRNIRNEAVRGRAGSGRGRVCAWAAEARGRQAGT